MFIRKELSLLLLLLVFDIERCWSHNHHEPDLSRSKEVIDEFIGVLVQHENARVHPIAESCLAYRSWQQGGAAEHKPGSPGSGMEHMVWEQPIVGLEVSHISKTGLTSFKKDVGTALQDSETYFSHEKCFAGAQQPEHKRLVFLRAPLRHIFSEFGQCYKGQFEGKVRPGFPQTGTLMGDYEAWLRNFVSLNSTEVGKEYDFNCYDARNMQTRFMSCRSDEYEGTDNYPLHGHLDDPTDLNRALENVHAADFIGLTDMYTESICMFEVRKSGRLSERCTCKARREASSQQRRQLKSKKKKSKDDFSHLDHHAPHVALDELLREPYLSMESMLTSLDKQLYVNALLRYLCDLRMAEEYLRATYTDEVEQHRIICPGDLERFQAELLSMGIPE